MLNLELPAGLKPAYNFDGTDDGSQMARHVVFCF